MDICENNGIIQIKNEMLEAVLQDNVNNSNNKAATAKLQKLSKFVQFLQNKKTQEQLLNENILEIVKKWLEPLPDKSLPNIRIRKDLLEALKLAKVNKAHLLESGVGKIVHFYMKSPRETKEIRNLAKEVVSNWVTRVINEVDESL